MAPPESRHVGRSDHRTHPIHPKQSGSILRIGGVYRGHSRGDRETVWLTRISLSQITHATESLPVAGYIVTVTQDHHAESTGNAGWAVTGARVPSAVGPRKSRPMIEMPPRKPWRVVAAKTVPPTL